MCDLKYKSERFFIFLTNYNLKTINEKNQYKYTFFSKKNIIKNRKVYLRGWGSPSGRVGMERLVERRESVSTPST